MRDNANLQPGLGLFDWIPEPEPQIDPGPKELTVLAPDYGVSDLGVLEAESLRLSTGEEPNLESLANMRKRRTDVVAIIEALRKTSLDTGALEAHYLGELNALTRLIHDTKINAIA